MTMMMTESDTEEKQEIRSVKSKKIIVIRCKTFDYDFFEIPSIYDDLHCINSNCIKPNPIQFYRFKSNLYKIASNSFTIFLQGSIRKNVL